MAEVCEACGHDCSGVLRIVGGAAGVLLAVIEKVARNWIKCDACEKIFCTDCCEHPEIGYCDDCIKRYDLDTGEGWCGCNG